MSSFERVWKPGDGPFPGKWVTVYPPGSGQQGRDFSCPDCEKSGYLSCRAHFEAWVTGREEQRLAARALHPHLG